MGRTLVDELLDTDPNLHGDFAPAGGLMEKEEE